MTSASFPATTQRCTHVYPPKGQPPFTKADDKNCWQIFLTLSSAGFCALRTRLDHSTISHLSHRLLNCVEINCLISSTLLNCELLESRNLKLYLFIHRASLARYLAIGVQYLCKISESIFFIIQAT